MPICPAPARVRLLLPLAVVWVAATAAWNAAPGVAAPRQSDDETAREKWQRVADVLTALDVREGSVVADVGAGGGFFTVRLARAVGPTGRVYAVDVSESVVRNLRRRIESEDVQNVEVIRGDVKDPKLPDGRLDAVLIVNAYHEMRDHQEMLARLRAALKPAGRLVLLEPTAKGRPGASRDQQAREHIIAIDMAVEDVQQAGFDVLERREGFVERPSDEDEWLLVARRSPY